ncbi:MAG: HEAT repeat domain-containing protein [Proteobacteria bacterium]|nr:HEAT repeat domain-containing protein [Pseudomonadota bacterium]
MEVVKLADFSDSMFQFAIWAMIIIIALTIIIFLQIVAIHAHRIIKKWSRDRFLAVCRPIVLEYIVGGTNELPRVGRAHLYDFLLFWNNLNDSLRGDARERLIALAYSLELNKAAVKMLRRNNVRKRFMAIATLGHMRDDEAWGELKEGLSDKNSYLSFASARAMVLINAEGAMEHLIPRMMSRADWAAFNMSGILKAAGPEAISEPLAKAALNADAEDSLSLLKYIDLADYSTAKRVVNELLKSAVVEEVITACLKALKDPEALHIVRRHTFHDCWFVRVQAAAALGRVGVESDKYILMEMLSDKEWWVRYRAAKALSKMPFVSAEELKNLQLDHHDRFSRDILMKAIAEGELT